MTTTLLLGSNLGDSLSTLTIARSLVAKRVGSIVEQSSVLRSAPWGFDSENDFYNQLLVVDTKLQPIELLDAVKEIEQMMGRAEVVVDYREPRVYTDRLIDIDILYYDDIKYRDERLEIPHPRIEERQFILDLLAEINHPII